ncbi:MAG TPA: alpha/beta hydrolase [Steroidobacteraceae bacterium]|nr:alpha/beta hydrolase [Steroidobacteraceae bacterium]
MHILTGNSLVAILGRALLPALALQLPLAASAAADDPSLRPRVDANGVAHLPATEVPASRFMSAASRARFIQLFSHPGQDEASGPPDVRAIREEDERKNAPYVARGKVLYPVTIEEKVLGGVRTQLITPQAGIAPGNRNRVLINLHGGGFIWGEGNGARAESIPIAALGRIKVVTVAYRMAPEFAFPAASQDVASVYRELLKDHRAENIGIYGCSAGGILTAESVAWFEKEKLPIPGAIGTFCGSIAAIGGDSSHVTPLLVGELASADADSDSLGGNPYFKGASPSDPLVLPINSPEVLSRFPPTLLIAGSRDFTVSSLFAAQAALTNAGVEAELHVWDGMWHAFFFDPDLPESKQVYRVVVDFFNRHLGHRSGPRGQRR